MMKKNLINFLILSICLTIQNGQASDLDPKITTFANFSYVRDVASTISHVYFATTSGIIRYDKMDDMWEEPLTGSDGIDHSDIFRIFVDRFDEDLFAVTSDGKYEYDKTFKSWYPVNEIDYPENDYYKIAPLDVMYPPESFNYSPDGYLIDGNGRDFGIEKIINDGSGNLWLGTWGRGPAYASTGSNVIELLTYGLIQNRVDAIFNDEGFLYIGGSTLGAYRSGISIFDPDQNQFDHLESGVDGFFGAYDITCFETDDDHVYVGTDMGLLIFDRGLTKVETRVTERNGLPGNYIHALHRVGDSLFIGADNGLGFLDIATDSLRYAKPREFLNTDIYDFAQTDSSLWLATSKGAYQLRFASGLLQKFQDPHMIIFSEAIKTEIVGSTLWLASYGGLVGLNLKDGETEPFKSSMLGVRALDMVVNDKIAVMTTELGFKLIFLDPREKKKEREFTMADGLPSSNVYALLLDGDFLWVGTDRGLARFLWNDPGRID